jgi:hypothetical protein
MKKIIGMAAMLFISAVAFAQKGYSDHSGNHPGTYNPADSKLASGRQGMNDNQNRDSKVGMHNQPDMHSEGDMHSNQMHRSRMHHYHSRMGYGTRRSHHYTIKHKYTHHYSRTQ